MAPGDGVLHNLFTRRSQARNEKARLVANVVGVLPALHRAIQQPVDGLETDCCLTADCELVLLHDPLLDLGTTVSGWAHQRTAAEIRAGRLRNLDGAVSDERPLLLDELLDLVREQGDAGAGSKD